MSPQQVVAQLAAARREDDLCSDEEEDDVTPPISLEGSLSDEIRMSSDNNTQEDFSQNDKENETPELSLKKRSARWKWSEEMVEKMIICLHEHQTKKRLSRKGHGGRSYHIL